METNREDFESPMMTKGLVTMVIRSSNKKQSHGDLVISVGLFFFFFPLSLCLPSAFAFPHVPFHCPAPIPPPPPP